MTVVNIRSNTDLINYLRELEQSTTRYFESNERSTKGLASALINLQTDLELNERMCKIIASSFKYFKGVVEGNGKNLFVTSNKATSLFSSIYYSIIRNLKIHNVSGSRGLLLADDISSSTIQNVELTGVISVEESMGGFARTSQNVTFEDCTVNIKTKNLAKDTALEQVNTDPTHFGAYVGVDLGGTRFVDCAVSGEVTSEVRVGGFCAHAKGTIFDNCTVMGLTVSGKREVGLFAGRGSYTVELINCEIVESKASSGIYTGFVIGRSTGNINIGKLYMDDSFITQSTASSFIGGIAGTAKKIRLEDSQLSGGIYGSFIIAGVCPDVEECEVNNNKFDMTITASGYAPMMTHVYPLVRTDFLTSNEKDIVFKEEDNQVNIKVIELEMEGLINPFKESIL